MGTARASLALAFTALLALVLPAAAKAQLSWQPPQTLSAAGQNAQLPQVAMDPPGDGVAVWQRFDGVRDRVQSVLRAPGGNFGGLRDISSAAAGSTLPRVAMAGAGSALSVWKTSDGTWRRLGSAFRPPSGVFNPPEFASPAGENLSDDVGVPTPAQVAIDPQGNGIAVWRRADAEGGRVEWAFRPAGGGWSAAQPLSPGAAIQPDVAMDRQGNALVVWSQDEGGGAGGYKRIKAAFRPAGGTFGVAQTLTPVPHGSNSAVVAPQVEFDGQGGALVVWADSAGEAGSFFGAAFRPPGGSFGAPTELGGAGSYNNFAMDMDDQGDAVVVWDRFNGQRYDVYGTFRPAGGNFAAATTISPAGQDAQRPQLAMGGEGSAVVVWRGDDGTDLRIRAAHRPAGGGFGAPQPLSDPGQDADRPQVAMDGAGNAIATWQRSDGQNTRVQSAIGVAPGVAPPPEPPPPPEPEPPPPPPPGGAVTAIRAAAPFERGKAVVLTADVAGPVQRLEWDLPSGDITGRVVNGELQRSVRFRPHPGTTFTAKVHAFGPDGVDRLFTRTFTAPRAPAGQDVSRVMRALSGPAVSAVGGADALLGRTGSCSLPTTVRSGKLELAGCFAPAQTLDDIPWRERGVIDSLARELNLPSGDAGLMRTAVELSDGFFANGPVTLNNNGFPISPSGGASIVAFPQAHALASSNAGLRIGGYQFGRPGGFVLDIDPRDSAIPLPDLPRPPSLPSIGGFKLAGDFDVRLSGSEAHIDSNLQLPSFLKRAGVDIQARVSLRATPDELIVEDMTIGPINADVGGLAVNQFKIDYRRAGDEWQGQGKACVISGACLDMIPPNGQIKIKNGRLDFAGASLGFPAPGIPLFAGVNLERIGFGFGLDPTRLTGNALVGVGRILKIDGRLVFAFPNAQTPFLLKRDEVGNGFPAQFYGRPYTSTTIGVTADAFLRVPSVGEFKLGNGYLLYVYPGYLALGGGVEQDFFGVVSLKGGVNGEFNAGNGRFNVTGNVRACVVDIVCAGAIGSVSSVGVGGCVTVDVFFGDINIGGGVRYSPFDVIIWPFDGCKWTRFVEPHVFGARAAQVAGGGRVVTIGRGDASRAIRLDGVDGAPRVRVTGPGGQTLTSSDGPGLQVSKTTRIIRSESNKTTVVGLVDPTPGDYKIELLPDSPAIAKTTEAEDPPDAKVTAKVSGTGAQRQLDYDVVKRPNQRVTFSEMGADGAGKQIGTVSGGGRGRLRFSPAPGPGPRIIKAQFELDGMPAEQRMVARFRPPSPRLARARGLRVRRSASRLQVSWAGVPGAARYELALTTSDGRQRIARTRRRTIGLAGVSKGLAGSVSVRAVAPLRQGIPTRVRFRATARRNTAMHRLQRCSGRLRAVCGRR